MNPSEQSTDLALSTPVSFLRCERCREHLDEDDLFCPNCGHEAPGEEHTPDGRMTVHAFDCAGCGASLTWELEIQGLRCAFCGQAKLEEKAVLQIPPPRLIVPFRIGREQATALYRAWLGRGTFRPGDLMRESKVTEMRGVYLPYWLFSIDCHAYWTADSNRVPPRARAAWAPCFGEHKARYASQLVPASGVLPPSQLWKVDAWDLTQAVPYTPEALRDHPAEAFAVPRKRARLTAVQGFEARLRQDCEQKMPGTLRRNVKINPLFTGAHAAPVLMPLWIMAYEYRGRTYRFLINGQSGEAKGNAPTSPWKALALLGLILLGLLLISLISGGR